MARCKFCNREVSWETVMPSGRRLPMEPIGRYIVRGLGADSGYSVRRKMEVRGRLLPSLNQAAEAERLRRMGHEVVYVWVCHMDGCPGTRERHERWRSQQLGSDREVACGTSLPSFEP